MRLIAVILFFISISFSHAQISALTKEVAVPITNIYIPSGFDTNDVVEIIVEGYLPTLCHFYPSVVIASQRDRDFLLEARAQLVQGRCAKTFAPFITTLKLDKLDAGIYRVLGKNFFDIDSYKIVNSPIFPLKVSLSTSAYTDSKVYANVSSIHSIDLETIAIQGYHPSECFQISEIVVESNGNNTIAILPVVTRDPNKDCLDRQAIFFTEKIVIPRDKVKNKKKALIHVRSMSGRALNYLHYFGHKL